MADQNPTPPQDEDDKAHPAGSDGQNNDPGADDEEAARRARMQELFGDILDEDGEIAEDTVEDLRAERDDWQQKFTRLSSRIEGMQQASDEARQKYEDAQKSLQRAEAQFEQNKKIAIAQFAHEVLPVMNVLGADLGTITQETRDADPKFAKLAEGVEKTIGQLAGVFNKYGIKEQADSSAKPAAPAQDAAATAPQDSDLSPETPAASAESFTPAPPKATDTVESLRAERDEWQQKFIDLSARAGALQQESMTSRQKHEEALKSIQRSEAKFAENAKFAIEKFVKDVLPVIDTLELGLGAIPKKDRAEDPKFAKLAQDLEKTIGNIGAVFNKHGVKSINPMGEEFDASKHEAISVMPKDDTEPETVIQVAQKGYEISGRLIRPAKVIITPSF